MSDGKGQQEPSMEEILASIRRIISEDADGAPAKAPGARPPSAAPTAAARGGEDVLTLSTRVDDDDDSPLSLDMIGRRADPDDEDDDFGFDDLAPVSAAKSAPRGKTPAARPLDDDDDDHGFGDLVGGSGFDAVGATVSNATTAARRRLPACRRG